MKTSDIVKEIKNSKQKYKIVEERMKCVYDDLHVGLIKLLLDLNSNKVKLVLDSDRDEGNVIVDLITVEDDNGDTVYAFAIVEGLEVEYFSSEILDSNKVLSMLKTL